MRDDTGREVYHGYNEAVPPESVALQCTAGRADAFTPVEAPVQAVGSRYIDWLVPGLLGMNIMSTGLWGVAFSPPGAAPRSR